MTERRYELDWLRVIAIAILLCYHTGMIFVRWEWHIKSQDTSRLFEIVMAWFHYWRMPLLLFISGAATSIVLSRKKISTYVKDRFLRLFIPLVFGMLVIVPPQIYFEKIEQYASYGDFYRTVFDFKPYPEGSLSWHHMWFVLYLLIFSLLALPFFAFLRSERSAGFYRVLHAIVRSPLGFIAMLLPIIATQTVLRPWFPEETHDLVTDWAYFTYYLTFFVYGYILYRDTTLWSMIVERRKRNVIAAAIVGATFYLGYLGPDTRLFEIVYDVSAIAVAWFTLLAAIGYAAIHLRRPAKWLSYANDAVYPFYILHQTVIIAIGYYVLRAHRGVYLNYVFIAAATFAVCLALYHFVIRPFAIMRILFGMKKPRTISSPESGLPGRESPEATFPGEPGWTIGEREARP